MEISAEKTKLMTNSANGIQREIKVKGQKLGTVTCFKYLGAVVSDDGSKPEVLSRIAQATAALTKLKPIWRDVFKVGVRTKHSTKQSRNSLFCYTKFHNKNELKFPRNCTKQTCLCLFRVLAGTEIFIFNHALNSGTSILHVNFMKNKFLRALICPFTNSQIWKRTNNFPIDK